MHFCGICAWANKKKTVVMKEKEIDRVSDEAATELLHREENDRRYRPDVWEVGTRDAIRLVGEEKEEKEEET